MLKPGWLDTVTDIGFDVWHALPTGMSTPATFGSTILIVIFDVVVTWPVLGSTVPVVGPSLMSFTVAVTGTSPSSLNEPVASGSDRAALIALVFRSAVAVR